MQSSPNSQALFRLILYCRSVPPAIPDFRRSVREKIEGTFFPFLLAVATSGAAGFGRSSHR